MLHSNGLDPERFVEVAVLDGPVPPFETTPSSGAGAVVTFEGIVRPLENGRLLTALLYETYEPMTTRELTRLAQSVVNRHQLTRLRVFHSRGRVLVGAVSFRLEVAATHRKAALLAMDEFIDQMKRDIPLWKRPQWPQ